MKTFNLCFQVLNAISCPLYLSFINSRYLHNSFFFFKFEKHVNELEVDLELFHIFNVSNIQFCSLEKVKYFSSGTISITCQNFSTSDAQ